ncbi:MAG: hypothetical protein L0I62_05745, partial [Gammaproteobacteria bacterium]|nr:hypothetical protein [Gammaproteobacteria bacterium]
VSLKNADFLWEFFMVQQFLRFLTPAQDRPGPWWYFFPLLLLAVLPWLAATGRALCAPIRNLLRRESFNPAVLLWLWVVLIFLFFSISDSKLPSYILPIIPALAILIGRELSRVEVLPWTGGIVSLLVSAIVIVLAVMAPQWGLGQDVKPGPLDAFLTWVIAAGSVGFAATVMAMALRKHAFPAIMLIAAAWLVAIRLIMIGGVALGPAYSMRALSGEVARYNQPGVPVYSVAGYEQILPYYLRRTVIIVRYQGEFDFGIAHARGPLENRYLPTLAAFAARWKQEPRALAFVPRERFAQVQALDIGYRIVAGNAEWVALVHEGRP